MARGPERRLVTLVVEPHAEEPADVIGDEPIWHDGQVVGLGDLRRLRPPQRRLAGPRLRARRPWPTPGPTTSRSRSSATVALPASSPSRCSIPRACGCGRDRAGRDTGRALRRTVARHGRGRATPWPWPLSGPASTPATAARCAWPATAGTAWPRWTASPGSGPARRRPGPAIVVRRHPAVGPPPASSRSSSPAAVAVARAGRRSWWSARGQRQLRRRRPRRRPGRGRPRRRPRPRGGHHRPRARRSSSGGSGTDAVELRPSPRRRGGARHWCRGAASRLPGQPAAGAVHGEAAAVGRRRRRRAARRGGHRRTAARRPCRTVPGGCRSRARAAGDRGCRGQRAEMTAVEVERRRVSSATPAGRSSSGSARRPATSWPASRPDVPVRRRRPAADRARTAAAAPSRASSARARVPPSRTSRPCGTGASASSSWSSGPACAARAPARAACACPHLPLVRGATARAGRPSRSPPARRRASSPSARPPPGYHLDAFRRTALHDEHLRLGAQLDRFGGWWRPVDLRRPPRGVLGGAASGERRRRVDPREDGGVRARTWSRRSSACTRTTSTTSARADRATRSCSTSAATSSTTA